MQMRIFILFSLPLAHALITLSTIRNLTSVTDECLTRIAPPTPLYYQEPLIGPTDQERDDIEATITTTLTRLSSTLIHFLNVPLHPAPTPLTPCETITSEYHLFLSRTVHYLRAIQELQMRWRWDREGGVARGLENVRMVWASRSMNDQERSFIEQQMELYDGTGCFQGKEVLRKGVEIVEYLNDLGDGFPEKLGG